MPDLVCPDVSGYGPTTLVHASWARAAAPSLVSALRFTSALASPAHDLIAWATSSLSGRTR